MARCEYGSRHGDDNGVIPCPTPARCGGEGEWWHVFGSPMKWDDENNQLKPCEPSDHEAFMHLVAGPGPAVNKKMLTPLLWNEPPGSTLKMPWLGSFPHRPTDEEIQALIPEECRDEDHEEST